ncbi:hypothetical protein PITC_069350 [Penicillium italicum]|uniref:Uncharacterized protein n=1 Tax=Penicillium italicum TaxID=40296 RepID=A0A0A2LEC8_PENIT|nr:hypothetical protein PITC_069350 [Penicillium italicum]
MSLQPPTIKNWPHNYDYKFVIRRLAISDRPNDQQALHVLAQEVFDVVALEASSNGKAITHLFRSSYSRNKVISEWRSRLHRVPAAVRNHVTNAELLAGALYKYLNCIQHELIEDFERRQNQLTQLQLAQKTVQQPTQQPTQQPAQQQSARKTQQQKTFDYTQPYAVPNGDIQIIRADHPEMPIAIRMADFLTDRGNPQDVCPEGDWINIANIRFEQFRENLVQDGFLTDGDTIWLNHLSLDQIDPALIANPQAGEVRLASFNLASSLLRTIRAHWPKLRNPSPDPLVGDRRSPLPRPNMTIIIRSGPVKGGALSAEQPALARPIENMGDNPGNPGNPIVSSRTTEQKARYAADRQLKNKRKREKAAEAGGEAGKESGADIEAGMDAPAARRRRLDVAPGTTTVPAAGIIPGFGLGWVADPAGQQPQEGNDDDAGLRALLGPEVFEELRVMGGDNAGQQPEGGDGDDSGFLGLLDSENFNEAGLMDNDSAALQAFFEQNEWTGEPMEED